MFTIWPYLSLPPPPFKKKKPKPPPMGSDFYNLRGGHYIYMNFTYNYFGRKLHGHHNSFSQIYIGLPEKKNFSMRFNKFLLYRHISPNLGPEADPWTMNFTDLVEGFMSIITMHSVFLSFIWE